MAKKPVTDWRTDPRFLKAAEKLTARIEQGKKAQQAKKGGK